MKCLLKENFPDKDGNILYVASHWKTGCQMQVEEFACTFASKADAETCLRNLKDYCGKSLTIVTKS